VRNEFPQSSNERFGPWLRLLLGVGRGDEDVDLKAASEVIGELDVELRMRSPGNGGDNRAHLRGFKVERRDHAYQTETRGRFAGDEDIRPRLDAGFVEVPGDPAGGGGQQFG
jgi:hypothetical protein